MLTIEKKSLKVGKYVSTQHVDEVVRNYKQERWIQNSERIGQEDSLSGWWSIEEMEEFLENAKMNGADGVRMYFGAYSKNYAEKPEYAGKQTLVMVATEQKETAQGDVVDKDIYINNGNKMDILAYNMIRLSPKASSEIGITLIDKGEKGMVVI